METTSLKASATSVSLAVQNTVAIFGSPFKPWLLIGEIGVSVDDVEAACQRFEDLGVNWRKRLTDGRMKNIAFMLDPDGYSIEVIPNDKYSDKVPT